MARQARQLGSLEAGRLGGAGGIHPKEVCHMAKFHERLRALRKSRGLTQQQLAEVLELSKSSVNMYERGEREPGFETLEAIAAFFHVDMNYLYGQSEVRSAALAAQQVPEGCIALPKMAALPIIGHIACGEPITAEENVEGEAAVPEAWNASFCLVCEGESMAPRIQDGDLVAIRKQEMVENGEIAAVRIDGEATLKHVYLYANYIELRPENPAYESIIKMREEMNEVHIEGKAVGLCRRL